MKIAQRFLQLYKKSSYRFIKHLRYFTAYKLSGGTILVILIFDIQCRLTICVTKKIYKCYILLSKFLKICTVPLIILWNVMLDFVGSHGNRSWFHCFCCKLLCDIDKITNILKSNATFYWWWLNRSWFH